MRMEVGRRPELARLLGSSLFFLHLLPEDNYSGIRELVNTKRACRTRQHAQIGKDKKLRNENAAFVRSGGEINLLRDKKALKASDLGSIQAPEGGFVSMVALDMDAYAEKYGKKAVKKTLTIPAWLNAYVESNGISSSKVLQDALGKMISA